MSSSLPRNAACCSSTSSSSSSSTIINFGGVSQGHGVPSADPANTAVPWLYTDLDSQIVYTWNVETQAWL